MPKERPNLDKIGGMLEEVIWGKKITSSSHLEFFDKTSGVLYNDQNPKCSKYRDISLDL